MNRQYDDAIRHAFDEEFAWLDDFKNPYENHIFSDGFEAQIKQIARRADYRYVSIGRRRIRRLFVALIARMLFAITCYAAVKAVPKETSTEPKIQWNETQNDLYGTLDVTFDTEGELPPVSLDPQIPDGYSIDKEYNDEAAFGFECSDKNGHLILYIRSYGIANSTVGIDNEDADFREVSINGFKGYSYRKEGINALFWTDGTDFYMLQGTCSMDVLWDMAATMKP